MTSGLWAQSLTISGKVEAPATCADKAMIWLSLDKDQYQERLLLMHTEVPRGGSFSFYVKPGRYQVRGSDKLGCEFMQKVVVTDKAPELAIKMVKK